MRAVEYSLLIFSRVYSVGVGDISVRNPSQQRHDNGLRHTITATCSRNRLFEPSMESRKRQAPSWPLNLPSITRQEARARAGERGT
jgi:hypothetical protein